MITNEQGVSEKSSEPMVYGVGNIITDQLQGADFSCSCFFHFQDSRSW